MKSFTLRIFALLSLFLSGMAYGQSVTLYYPNGFESLNVGSVNGILWNYSGFNSVRIELSTNNGATWTTIPGASSLPNTQSYFNWTVPAQISALCQIRIVDTGNSLIRDVSNNNFSIVAAPVVDGNKYIGGFYNGYALAYANHVPVKVNYPNGGDIIVAGTRQYISWTYNSLNQVDVEYSVDNGSNWTNISTLSAIQGYVIWNVPVLLSNTCLVRVIDILNSNNVDQSDATFSIIGVPSVSPDKYSGGGFDGYNFNSNANPVRVIVPNGAENYVAGNVMNISWYYPSLNNVNIHFSSNNGSNWSTVVTGVPATSASYNYTIPITQTASSQCLVRVQDAVNGAILDISDNTFDIQSTNRTFGGSFDGYSFGSNVQRLLVVYPDGGDTLYSGNRTSITWTYQSLNLVQPSYSVDNGSTWTNIGSPVPANQGSVNWTVPVAVSNTCLVRVMDFADPLNQDISNQTFTILGQPTLDLAKYSGGTFDGYNYAGPKIDLLSPDGGEQYLAGTPMDIHWRYHNSVFTGVPSLAIELSTDGGSTWTTTIIGSISAATGFYRFTTPSVSTTQARVRVRDLTNTLNRDSSIADFTIIAPFPTVNTGKYSGGSLDGYTYAQSANPVTVVSPNGGEFAYVGSQVSIIWNYNSYNNVQVSGSSDNGSTWFNIGSPLQGVTGILNWQPTVSHVSANCRVRIVDVNNPTIRDSSDAVFTIASIPVLSSGKYSGGSLDGYSTEKKLTIVNANGGEVFYEGQSISINWNYLSMNTLTLEASTNGGSAWFNLSTTLPGNQFGFNWTPSGAHVSTNCLFRITDNSNSSVTDVSDAVFEIRAALVPLTAKYSGGTLDGYTMGSTLGSMLVTYPNGAEVFYNGTRVALTWNYISANTVQLAYSTNNGSAWTNITTLAGNTGYYNWTVPSVNSNQVLFRVHDVSQPLVRDSSDAVFSILPLPSVNSVKYSGGGYDGYVSHSNLSPDPIRYVGGSYDGYNYGSTKPFMTLLNPIGGETWYVGSVQAISWNYLSLNNIQIQISTNSGSTFTTLGTVAAMNGALNYTVPNTPSSNCRVRIFDTSINTIVDSSASDFTIAPMPVVNADKYMGGSFDGYAMRSSISPVTVITPNGGDNLFVGTQYTIIWNYNSQNNVRIELSTDGGSTFSTIVASVPAQQRNYNWLVPGTLSNTCRIRVRDALSSGINDVSDADFSIVNLPIVNNDKYFGGSLDGYADADACVSPIATISGGANLCTGNTTILTVTQSGTTPYSITYTDGVTPTTITGINFTPYFIVLTPTVSATYSLVSISNCLGAGTVNGSAAVQVSPAPVATLSGTSNICTGGSAVLTVNLVGIAPWNFSYTDGTTLTTITGVTTNPYQISVTPTSNANYSLTGVSTSCGTGTFSGNAAITLNPPPVAVLAGNQTICAGSSANISVNFTGGGPFTLTWTNGVTPVTQSGITANPYFISVTPSASTTYTATALNTTCTGTASGSAAVIVNPRPTLTLSGSQVICPGNSSTLTFALTGSAPWNISYSDGTTTYTATGITGSPYLVSHTPAFTRTYTPLTFSDQLCAGLNPSGTAVVQVNTPPVASISGTQSVCTGNTATLTVNLSGPNPWSIVYTDGTTPVSVTGITSSPYLAIITPAVNSTYSLQSVSSNCAGSVSGQALITMVTSPTAVLSGSQTICPGSTASLTVNLTGGGPWNIVYTDGTNPVQITGINTTPYVFNSTPSGPLTYQLSSVVASCSGTVSGNAVINTYALPIASISGTSTICPGNGAQLTFTLGGTSPWNLTYTDGTTQTVLTGLTSSPYLASVSPVSGRTYSVVSVSDVFCTSSNVPGTAVVTVQPVPSAAISGTGTVCAGSIVNMSVALTGVAPWDITYTDGTTQTQVTGIVSSPYILPVSSTSTRTYTLVSVGGSCAGTVSGQAVLTITPSPTASMTGTATVCPGNPTVLSVNFTSVSPWQITYSQGTTNITQSGITANPYLISVTPTTTTTYTLVSVQNNLCTGVASGAPVVTVSPAPHATMSGTAQVCVGTSTPLSVQFTGAGPWDIIWTDGTTPVQATGLTSNPYVFNVTPSSSRTYTVSSVLSGCLGTVSGSAQVQVFPVPTAAITGGAVICTGGSTTLSVTFTGPSPWAYTYTDGTLQTTYSGINTNPHIITVNPNSTRTYSLVSMNGICPGTVSGTALVTVNNQLPNAILSGNNTICTNNPTSLSFNLTGNSPWSVIYTDGVVPYTISGITSSPHIVSVTPVQNTTYSILNVNNVCGNGVVFGTAQISTSAGPQASMSGAVSVCAGGQTTLSVTLSGPSPWNLSYTDGTTPVTRTGITASPFLIQVTPSQNTTYSLTSVSSSCLGTATGSVQVSVLSPPVATLTGTQTICASQPSNLTISLSGAGPWDVTWTDGTTQSVIPGITSTTYVLSLSPSTSCQYQLVSVTGGCVGTVSGTAFVTVIPAPLVQLSAPAGFCPGSPTQLSFTLTGLQPWSVIFTDGFTPSTYTGITSSPFIVSVTPSGTTTYDVTALADGNCVIANPGAQTVVTPLPVPVANLSGSGTVCAGTFTNFVVGLTGSAPWNITYTDGTTLASVSGITSSPYSLSVSALSSRTYSLTSVSGGGCAGTFSGTANLNISPSPLATMSGTATVCPGNGTNLSITLTGSAPWNITYTDGTTPVSVTGINTSPFVVSVSPVSTRTYSVTTVSDALCSGTGAGVAIITTSPAPTASMSGVQQICSGNGANLSVNFTGSGPWNITWTNGVTPVSVTGITNNPYVFAQSPVANTTYSLVSVFSGCAGTVSGTTVVQVSTVPTAAISGGSTICTGGITSLSVAFTGAGPWNFTYSDGTNPTSITGVGVNPFILAVSPSTTRTYSLLSMSGVCTGTVSGSAPVTVNTLLPNAVLSGSNTICTGNTTVLTVNLTGNSPWSVTYTDGVIPFTITGISSSPYLVTVTPVSATTYSILNVNNVCGNGVVFGNAIINPTVTPTAVISGASTICPGGFAVLSVQMTGSTPWNISYSDGTTVVNATGVVTNPYLIQVTPSVSSTYQITAFSNACPGTFSGSGFVSVLTGGPSATITGTQTICNGQPANMSISLTGTPPWSVVYTNGINQSTVNNIVISPYVFQVTPTFASTYSMISVTDGICSGNAVPTPAVISLTNPPVAGITGSHTICSGQVTTLTTVLTGNGPWNITYTNGVTPVTINGINTSPYIIQVSPSVSSTYILTNVFSLCNGTTSGQANVQVNVGGPSATWSASQTVCAGTGVNMNLQLTGQSPWNITWTDGTNNTTVNGITSSPYTFSVTPLTTTSYSLTQISDALCTGTLPLIGSVVNVIPQPVAVITGTQSVCLGSQASMSVSLSGNGPWNIIWTDGVNSLTVTGITNAPYVFNTTPSVNTTYSLISVSNQCTGSVGGSAVVSVLPALNAVLSGNRNICPSGTATLTATITGASPWNITWTDGTTPVTVTGITQSPYVFTVTPSATITYTLVSVSNNVCTGSVSGSALVQVLTVPTASISGAQTICQGNTASISVGFTGSMPLTLRYSNGFTNVTIAGITSNPYMLQVSPSTTTTYTLSGLNNTCPGTFSGSSVVAVNPLPSASMGGNQGVCVGNPAIIPVTLSGNSPWFFVYTDGTLNYTVTGITSSPYNLSVTPLASTAYTITTVNDLLCSNVGNFGTSLVSIVSPPTGTITGPGTLCSGNTGQLNVFLTGSAPWNIQYSDGTNSIAATGISTSPYVIHISPTSSTQYVLTDISDQTCNSTGLNHTALVNITTGPTAALTGSQIICSGQQAALSVVLTGTAPWSVQYSDGSQLVTIPGISSPLLTLNVSPGSTTAYSLVSVSDALCSGAVSGTATVTVNTAPTAGITGSTSVCSGGSAQLSVNLTGSAPFSFSWSDGVNIQTVNNVTSSPYLLSVTPSSTTFYAVTSVSSGNCLGNTTGTAIVTVGPTPTADFGSSVSICAGQTAVAGVSLSGLGPWTITYSDGVNTSTVTGITSGSYGLQLTPITTTTYTLLSVTDGTCPGAVLTNTLVVNVSTNLPSAAMAGAASVCTGNIASLVLNFTGSSPWSLTYSDGLSNITLTGITSSPYLFNVAPMVTTTYTPVAVANACGVGTVSGNAIITVDTQAPSASFTASTNGYTASFNNTSVGGSLYIWNFGDGNTSNTFNPQHTYAVPGLYTVNLTVVNACGTFSTSQQIFINYGVGVDADQLDKAITIYPNPSAGKFQVGIEGLPGLDVQITVTDMTGKTISDDKYFSIDEKARLGVDIERHTAGVYLLKVKGNDGIEVSRKITVVKE